MSVVQDIEQLESYEKMKKAFWEFHLANPHVYDKFYQECTKLIERHGIQKLRKNKIRIRLIFEKIRAEEWIQTLKTDKYKINNNSFKFYAFLFQKQNPQYAGCFEHRGYVPETIRELITS